jgi:hypothetical protein
MILVIDNFIKDKELLNKISKDSTFFNDPGEYYWWDGWWTSPINSVKKELIEYIWGVNCPINTSYNIAGFEYWTGIQSAVNADFKDKLDLHIDKDEELMETVGQMSYPDIGTVYYPEQDSFKGGMLEIYTEGADAAPEVVYAKPNRLIIFEAGKCLHRVTKVTEGTRKAIAINLWSTEPIGKQSGTFHIEP